MYYFTARVKTREANTHPLALASGLIHNYYGFDAALVDDNCNVLGNRK